MVSFCAAGFLNHKMYHFFEFACTNADLLIILSLMDEKQMNKNDKVMT